MRCADHRGGGDPLLLAATWGSQHLWQHHSIIGVTVSGRRLAAKVFRAPKQVSVVDRRMRGDAASAFASCGQPDEYPLGRCGPPADVVTRWLNYSSRHSR